MVEMLFSCQCQQHHSFATTWLWPSFLFFLHLHPFLFSLKKGICHGQISLINLSFSTSIIIISTLSFHFLLLCYLINTLPFQYHESFGNPYASTVSFSSSVYTQIFPWSTPQGTLFQTKICTTQIVAENCHNVFHIFFCRMFKRSISFFKKNKHFMLILSSKFKFSRNEEMLLLLILHTRKVQKYKMYRILCFRHFLGLFSNTVSYNKNYLYGIPIS